MRKPNTLNSKITYQQEYNNIWESNNNNRGNFKISHLQGKV